MNENKIAVIIPCYNEEQAIEKVIKDFHKVLPEAEIYVYDNNSTDKTAQIACKAGAIVRQEPLQGKGNVVRRMFADIDADIYVMSDGDETYDIAKAPILVKELLDNNLDMVIGSRKEVDLAAYRVGHRWGNVLLTKLFQSPFDGYVVRISGLFASFCKNFSGSISRF